MKYQMNCVHLGDQEIILDCSQFEHLEQLARIFSEQNFVSEKNFPVFEKPLLIFENFLNIWDINVKG